MLSGDVLDAWNRTATPRVDGSFSMIEERVPAGQSPPLHVYQSDDEMWYILDGTVTFEVDGERFTATTGSTVFCAARAPTQLHHRRRDAVAHVRSRTRP